MGVQCDGVLKHLWHSFIYSVCILKAILIQLITQITCRLPFIGKVFMLHWERLSHMTDTALTLDDWVLDFGRISWNGTRHFAMAFYYDFFKQVHIGGPAVDVDLLHLDGSSSRLFDFCRKNRPLVINLGSLS